MEAKRPAAADSQNLHQSLIDQLKGKNYIQTPHVEAAFRAIPRHLFLPDVALEKVYRDEAIPTKKLASGEAISSSSQPAIMAIMLEQLDLKPGHRVLEVGAGTGYNAALIAHIVGETGQVTTLDFDEDIVAKARNHLNRAGFDNVQVVCRDGVTGYPDAAPFDRIILTVGAWDISPAWPAQLTAAGRLVLPLALTSFEEKSVAFDKGDGYLCSVSIKSCGFMKLRGNLAAQSELQVVHLGPEPGLRLICEANHQVDAEAVYQWLMTPGKDWPTTIEITRDELFQGSFWRSLRLADYCILRTSGAMADCEIVPSFFVKPGQWRVTGGLLGEKGICLFMIPPDQQSPPQEADKDQPFELFVRSFGSDDQLAQYLIGRITAWDAAGRPINQITQIKVYPLGTAYTPAANEIVRLKKWTQLVIEISTKFTN